MIAYEKLLKKLDKELAKCFKNQKDNIYCRKGCSECCEKGDYPLTQIELEYVMQGYAALDNEIKIKVQKNFKDMIKGEACPFLIDKICSIYPYRPIICRTHGLAYKCGEKIKIPYCVNNGKNFSKACKDGVIYVNPVKQNLDTLSLLEGIEHGEMRDLYDWIKHKN